MVNAPIVLSLAALLAFGALSVGWALFLCFRRQRSVSVGPLSRRYLLWLPRDYRGNEPLPVVLAFHPGMATPHGFAKHICLHLAPEAKNFVIIYPEGYGRSWNAGNFGGAAHRHNVDDLAFVRAILDDVARIVAIDRRRVYATGHSNGARFCYYAACKMSEEIAAIATVGGAVQLPVGDWRPERPVSILHLHGLEDRWVPFEGGASVWKNAPPMRPIQPSLRLWAKLANATIESHEALFGGIAQCVLYSSPVDSTKVELCRIPGLGHHWPGTRTTRKYRRIAHLFGPFGPLLDLDQVNDTILRFLSAHSLPQLPKSCVRSISVAPAGEPPTPRRDNNWSAIEPSGGSRYVNKR
jgi:polyhydroxybutyrate depolymerase